uniref:Immunoglobulin domain-containing protein n=1 Tax=Cyprinus carpio TaxID=7962 RepID=A0A8C2CFH7_CYPCA
RRSKILFVIVSRLMEGHNVTLSTGVTKQQRDKMLWYFNDTLIALINGDPSKSCLYYGEGEIFRDRLDVDYETGSLIITDITTQHAGRYEANFIQSKSTGTSQSLNRNSKCDGTKITRKMSNIGETIKTLSVFGVTHAVKSISVMEGDTVTLNTDITKKEHDKMLWYSEETRIALINGHLNISCLYDGEDGRFRDRLKVDYKTGSLIITNITTEHAGRYEAEIIRSESSGKRQSLNRNRKCDRTKITKKASTKIFQSDCSASGLSPAAVAGVVGVAVAAVAVVVVVGVIYFHRRSSRNGKHLLQIL